MYLLSVNETMSTSHNPEGAGEAFLVLLFFSYSVTISSLIVGWYRRRAAARDNPRTDPLDSNVDVEEIALDDYWVTTEEYTPSDEFKRKFVAYASFGLVKRKDESERGTVAFRVLYWLAGVNWMKVGLFLTVWMWLWLFLVCLGLMSTGFKLLGGKDAAKMFDVVDNPISGLMIGILATVLVQSSSTTTSIIVGLVGADEMSVQTAIPMIMGANVGTSVTNTIVSLGHYGSPDEMRRGFAAATVHDCFNLLSVAVMLPVQWVTNVFDHLTHPIAKDIDACDDDIQECDKQEFLQPYIKPYYQDVAKYDKKVAKYVSQGYCDGRCSDDSSLEMRKFLTDTLCANNGTDCKSINGFKESWLSDNGVLKSARMPKFIRVMNDRSVQPDYLMRCVENALCENTTVLWNTTNNSINSMAQIMLDDINGTYANEMLLVCDDMDYGLCDARLLKDGIFYRDWHLSDKTAGALCVCLSLTGITTVLYLIVQTLNLLIKGTFARLLKRTIAFNGYLSILIGMFITIMVQSSSITTSVLTPLVAIGLVPLDDMYPLTLGANIGTTVTGLIAASVVTSNPVAAWQVALSHLLFNVFGILMWYPVEAARMVPLRIATYLGEKTVRYKSFPIAYTGIVFFVIPAAVYGCTRI